MNNSKNNNTVNTQNDDNQKVDTLSNTQESYTNYIDTSEVIIEYYKNQPTTGLEGTFIQIQEWLNKPYDKKIGNVPLILEADEGAGKKTTIVKWMQHHQLNSKKKYQDIILSHFATTGGNNQNYYFAIYRFLVKLREILNIGQKVELLEQKLRKYFYYWLEVCNEKLKNQINSEVDTDVIYDNIILIIEGIDHFRDPNSDKKETPVSFWLPKVFPEHIQIIVTADKDSSALKYFQQLNCRILQLPTESRIFENIVLQHSTRELFINEENKQQLIGLLISKEQMYQPSQEPNKKMTSLFIQSFLSTLAPYPSDGLISSGDIPNGLFDKILDQLDYKKLEDIFDIQDLFNYVLEFYQKRIMSKQRYVQLLLSMSLTQKGLYLYEIELSSGVDENEWKMFVAVFQMFLMKYQDLWVINNDIFKNSILQKYGDHQTIESMHYEIAQILNKNQTNSIRKLEEQTYHLYNARTKNFELKEVISTIENFLLLFNPNNKYDLCRYWQKLQECHFDPVIEYNKSIEGFQMHYHPSKEDTFRIIVQISRFLKEFADFETYFTPEFRHPPIKGAIEDLDDIGLYDELKNLKMFNLNLDEKVKQKKTSGTHPQSQPRDSQSKIEEKIKKIRKKLGMMTEAQIQQEKDQKLLEKVEKGQQKESMHDDAFQSKQDGDQDKDENKKFTILQFPEMLNIDIPSNREEFRKFYIKQLEEVYDQKQNQKIQQAEPGLMDTSKMPRSEAIYFQKQYDSPEQQDPDDHKGASNNNQPLLDQLLQVENESGNDKNFETQKISQLRDHYYLHEHEEQTNYYYKRWLWVQFPWSCLSIKCDYSAKLHECFSSTTKYISIEKERLFTQQALQIAIDAKLKKMSILNSDKSVRYDSNVSNIKNNLSQGESSSTKLPKILSRSSSQINVETNGNNSVMGEKGNVSTVREDTMMSFTDSQASSQSSRNIHAVQLADPVEMQKKRKMPAKVRNYAQSTVNLKHTESDEPQFNSGIFLTEDFLSQTKLNRELDQKLKQNQSTHRYQEESIEQNVDQYNTSLILQKSQMMKDKSKQNFDPINSIKDTSNYSIVLPQLKSSILNHSIKQLSLLEGQNVDLQKQYDNLVYTNNVLAKQLRDLKIIQHNINSYGNDGIQTKEKADNVYELQEKLAETEDSFLRSLVQIERLKTILRICDDNQTQNEEWIKGLNKFLVTLKKAIKYEQEEIVKIEGNTSELSKANQFYLNALQDKMSNEDRLMREIHRNLEEKKQIDFYFSNTDDIIEGTAIKQHQIMKNEQSGIDQNQINQQKQNLMKENNQQISEELEQLIKQIEEIKKCIDITKSNFEESPEYQNFLVNLEKNRELNATILKREQTIDGLEQQYKNLKNEYKVHMEADEYRQNSKKNAFEITSKQDLDDGQNQEKQESSQLNSPVNSLQELDQKLAQANKKNQESQKQGAQERREHQISIDVTNDHSEKDKAGENKEKGGAQKVVSKTDIDLNDLDDKELAKLITKMEIQITNQSRQLERLQNYKVICFVRIRHKNSDFFLQLFPKIQKNTYTTFEKKLNQKQVSVDQTSIIKSDGKEVENQISFVNPFNHQTHILLPFPQLIEKLQFLKKSVQDKLEPEKLEQFQKGELELTEVYKHIVSDIPRKISQNSSAVSSETNISKSQYRFGQY